MISSARLNGARRRLLDALEDFRAKDEHGGLMVRAYSHVINRSSSSNEQREAARLLLVAADAEAEAAAIALAERKHEYEQLLAKAKHNTPDEKDAA